MAGKVTISLEIELAWGVHDTERAGEYDTLSNDRSVESETLNRLLTACEQWNVPISFDVVGHLLSDSCDGTHAEAPHDSGWFDADPGGTAESDPLFYAPSLVKSIVDSPVNHEICTHTFSHVLCDRVSRPVLDWELETAKQAHRDFGLSAPSSLVPPRGRLPPLDALTSHDIRAIRVPYLGTQQPFTKPKYLKSAVSPPVTSPTVEDGVVHSHCTPLPSLTSPLLPDGSRPAHPAAAAIPVRLRRAFHRRYLAHGLKNATEQNGHIHYWSHLYNLSNEYQLSTVIWFVETLGRARERGEVDVLTMKKLADRTLSASA